MEKKQGAMAPTPARALTRSLDLDHIRQAAAEICHEWQELERPGFDRRHRGALDIDSPAYVKTAFERQVYICLDVGSGPARSGRGIIDKRTGDVWDVTVYAVPNKRHYLGNVFVNTPAEIAAKLVR